MIEKWTTPIPKLSGREGRTVYVYVPDEAQENPEARYPVLYMFDGHNVSLIPTRPTGSAGG